MLRDLWEQDRAKKAVKKQEREALRQEGLLGSKARNERTDLHMKYQNIVIDAEQIKEEIRTFMCSERTAIALPPMSSHMRASLHRLAKALSLKSKSQGHGDDRFPILMKTAYTHSYDAEDIEDIDALLQQRKYFPRGAFSSGRSFNSSGKGPKAKKSGSGKGGGISGAGYADGEVVGAGAPEIGAENKGRALLEKMGWTVGMGIGAINNKGGLEAVQQVVKNTKAGLG